MSTSTSTFTNSSLTKNLYFWAVQRQKGSNHTQWPSATKRLYSEAWTTLQSWTPEAHRNTYWLWSSSHSPNPTPNNIHLKQCFTFVTVMKTPLLQISSTWISASCSCAHVGTIYICSTWILRIWWPLSIWGRRWGKFISWIILLLWLLVLLRWKRVKFWLRFALNRVDPLLELRSVIWNNMGRYLELDAKTKILILLMGKWSYFMGIAIKVKFFSVFNKIIRKLTLYLYLKNILFLLLKNMPLSKFFSFNYDTLSVYF